MSKTYYEIHADGVKEISQEEMDKLIAMGADLMVNDCPFCPIDNPCNQPHCPYTKEKK